MDPYLLALIALVTLVLMIFRKAGADSRRRKRAWAAYYGHGHANRIRRRAR